jgi:hypothetical protein
VDLPREGKLYAFSEVRMGAPLSMEGELPFVVGIVDLSNGLRVLSRIAGARAQDLRIGQTVHLEMARRADGNVWFRFTLGGD